MELGIHYAYFSHPDHRAQLATRLTETAKLADEGGVNLFTVMDHWYQMVVYGGAPEPMLEGYTTLGYLAGITSNVRLSMLVTGVTYRHPGLLAKIVTTLDVLARGRALLGIGAAWYQEEHEGLGVPFPSTSERFERLEEAIQVVNQMWSDDNGAYAGSHYQLAGTYNVPQPPRGRVPILIGGGGEKKTLKLVADYADAWHGFAREGVDGLRHKLDVLREHCDRAGRDLSSIELTMGGMGVADPAADPDGFLTAIEPFAALGFTVVTMTPQGPDPVAWTEKVVTDVLPRLAQI